MASWIVNHLEVHRSQLASYHLLCLIENFARILRIDSIPTDGLSSRNCIHRHGVRLHLYLRIQKMNILLV